jgi:Putative transposase
MTERAARLVTEVLPWTPVRQWVLSLPYRLRYVLAWNHELCRAVLTSYRQRTMRCGTADGRTGTLTVIQRFGGGLNLNVHFHTLVLDGVVTGPVPGGPWCSVRRRRPATLRWAAWSSRGAGESFACLHAADTGRTPGQPQTFSRRSHPCCRASWARRSSAMRSAAGPERGSGVSDRSRTHRGLPPRDRAAPTSTSLISTPTCAWPATTGGRLKHLCRYLLRPPVAQERLRLLADGRVLVQLKRAWTDGTSHLLFEPFEFLEKLAALTPRPRTNLILYHGVLGPHARWRSRIVPGPARQTLDPGASPEQARGASADDKTGPPRQTRHGRWADLMRRAFDIDVLACPHCGNRMRRLATIQDPRVVEQILTHLGLPSALVLAGPAQPPPASTPHLFADTLA